MGIRELKGKIENKIPINNLIIFKISTDQDMFLINQYIEAISSINKKEISYIEDYLETIDSNSLFNVDSNSIQVCRVEEFDSIDERLKNISNLIIIASKIGVKVENVFSDFIVNVPKLEDWQLKNYVETKLDGVKSQNIERFFNSYKDNVFKLDSELSKISIFPNNIKNYILENSSLESKSNIFSLINGLIKRDKNLVVDSLKDLGEIEPLGFLSLLYNSFKNVINIQLNPKATPQTLNMNQKQFNAIKYYSINYYNKKELIDIFEMLTSIDYKIKSGKLPIDITTDYIITNILR